MNEQQTYRFLWQRTEKEEARLLRVYGCAGQIRIPDKIGGMTLTEIGAYCFSTNWKLPCQMQGESGKCFEETIMEEIQQTDGTRWEAEVPKEADILREGTQNTDMTEPLRELCGDYIDRVVLPDTIRKIGDCAFYNCRSVIEIEVGKAAAEIGSDAFMNCKHFTKLIVHGDSLEVTGIRKMLGQIVSDMEVYFKKENMVEAAILFPEYAESYDEITPAHFFGRKIIGEGFRARQCFKDGIFDFTAYDAIFEKACVEETEKTLLRMAGNRLRYPKGLLESAKWDYQEYVKAHAAGAGCIWVLEKNLDMLHFLCREQLLASVSLDETIRVAVRMQWTEGAASLMRWKREFIEQAQEKRYEF